MNESIFCVLLVHFQVLYVDTNTIVKGSATEGSSSTGIFRLIGCHQDPLSFHSFHDKSRVVLGGDNQRTQPKLAEKAKKRDL